MNNLAWAYYRTNDDRAIPTAAAALREAPLNANVQDTLGWLMLERGGDVDRALGLLESAARTTPNSPIIRYHLAAGLAKKGKTDAARIELKNLLGAVGEFSTRAEAQALLDSL